MCRHSLAPPPRGLIFGSLLAAPGLLRSWGWASRGPRLERPWLLQGARSARQLAFSFLGAGLQEKTLCGIGPARFPGFQGGFSPGVPFPGGDRRPFWARSEGSVFEPPGAKALSRRESLGLGPGGISCGAGVPRPPVGNCFSPESVQGPRWTSQCQGWAVGGAQREACPWPKPLGGSLLCFLGVPECSRLFSE